MNDIQCWALSPGALRCLTGRDATDPGWFQWACALQCGVNLERIRRLDLAGAHPVDELDEWVTRVSRQAITPILVLHDDDTLPGLAGWPTHWDMLATLRVGDTVPESKSEVLSALSVPDPGYLEAWARFVNGVGRNDASPVCAWPELGVAYAKALEGWRVLPIAQAACGQLGIELDAWNGPPLQFRDFHAVPRPDGAGNVAFDLATHPGAGAVKKKMQGWRPTGLLPPAGIWDPHGELREDLDYLLFVSSQPSLRDRVEIPERLTADTSHGVSPTWTLRSVSSDRWELKVHSPAPQEDRHSPPAVLAWRGEGDPPVGDDLRLSFVCIDREQHWTQPTLRVTLLLTLAPRLAGDVRCAQSRNQWRFNLPVRRLVEPEEMRPASIVCIGIEVGAA